mmetsp:Transcript_107365/g.334659  ORF Transcript_107365/g.334659 Transcript_107365/m.334659 type:complete len:340 (-) Transcript_107365:22-1041(-)|eukprot:CAMPEP_0204577026 /NCGR_PEP_ID=MMETSP0661-20131031/42112_1 /ASSEMBLY_ACC=CAM_ASM_000606 /TAXON_ID=109239 /ORGANISM="Alexandrium margalefi, Strain AMGDE01CS-322" /LENGTH=339 /DNA_ID=CAMNT_0051585827 /DNA_START=49 /DNA_END=1068 /DNA_ORIENTATION=-
MEALSKNPKLLAAAAVVAGSAAVLRWLATAPLPKGGAEERAALAREWWVKYLKITPHFDQFIKDLVIKSMTPDGKASGTIVVKGALLSSEGTLHEAGLYDLIDTFGSLPIMAAGYPAGVSLEIGASILGPVAEGEELVVESQILRIGSTVGFTAVEVRTVDGRLVASGTHTKHIGQPLLERMRHNLFARVPPLARWFSRRGMQKLEDVISSKGLRQVEVKTMDEALGLQLMPPGNEHGAHSVAMESLHLLNGYWAGHGASSAGLMAAAVREHLKQEGCKQFSIQDMSVLYMNPVPPFKHVGFIVKPLAAPGGTGSRPYVVEMKNEKKIFVRARLTVVVS